MNKKRKNTKRIVSYIFALALVLGLLLGGLPGGVLTVEAADYSTSSNTVTVNENGDITVTFTVTNVQSRQKLYGFGLCLFDTDPGVAVCEKLENSNDIHFNSPVCKHAYTQMLEEVVTDFNGAKTYTLTFPADSVDMISTSEGGSGSVDSFLVERNGGKTLKNALSEENQWYVVVGPITTWDNQTYTNCDIYMGLAKELLSVASVTVDGTTTNYDVFSEAVSEWNSAGNGAVLTLLKDVTITESIQVSGTKTLDLNGFGITYNGENPSSTHDASVLVVSGSGNELTINDSSSTETTNYYYIDDTGLAHVVASTEDSNYKSATSEMKGSFKGGYITGGKGNKSNSGGGLSIDDASLVTMNAGTIIGNSVSAAGGGVRCFQSEFTMNGGMIIGNTSGGYGAGIHVAKPGGTAYVNVTINGGSICKNTCRNTMSFTNGDEEKASGICHHDGTLTLSGNPTIEGNSPADIYINTNLNISIGDSFQPKSLISVRLKTASRTFTAGANYTNNSSAQAVFKSAVGGYEVIAEEKEAKLIPAVAIVTTSGGSTTYYETIEAATNSTNWPAGSTLKLLDDIKTTSTISVPNDVHYLDLNGYNITAQTTDSNRFSVIYVGSNANLTLTGEGIISGGKGTQGSKGDSGDFSSHYYGGGVYVSGGTFIMQGGTISGNEATHGGGVFVQDSAGSSFNMTGGKITSNRVSVSGGGTYIKKASTMSGTAEISNNTAINNGGGVYIEKDSFNMNGGKISGNSASNGGGVYVGSGTTFTVISGTIAANTATANGGGINNNGTFNISGNIDISENKKGTAANNIYLQSGKLNTVDDALNGTNPIGVSMRAPGVFTSGGSFTDDSAQAIFKSEQEGYVIKSTDDGNAKLVATHKVTYNYKANGGTESTKETAAVASGDAIDLTPKATKTGWTQVGWNTNQNATTALESLNMGDSDVTLYAIYKKTLTGTFYSGANATEQVSTTIYNTAESGSIKATALKEKEGWTAVGWNESDNAYTSGVNAGSDITLSSDKTYYGVYSQGITVSYNANGGESTPNSQTGTRYVNVHSVDSYRNPTFTIADAIVKSECDFNGWHVGSTDGETIYSAGQTAVPLSESVTLYAGWNEWDTVNTPTFSPESDTFIGPKDITISCMTDGVTIYYTTDGTAPTTSSTVYTGPVTINESVAESKTTLKAIAVKNHMKNSAVASADYTTIPRTYTLSVTAPTFDVQTYGYTQPDAQALTITSSGNSNAAISSVALSGANAASFSLNKTDGTTITAGSTDSTTYTVRPNSGLNAGTYAATVTVTYNNGATATAELSFTVNPADVTLTASSDTKTYNGQEQTVTGFTSSVQGLTFTGVNASGSGTDFGEYAVTFSGVTVDETKDSTGNYVVTGTTNGKLTINRKSVSITAGSGSKSKDGSPLTNNTFTASALEVGDTHTFTVVMTAASTISDVGSTSNVIATVDDISVTTGKETIVGNYLVTTANGTLTISEHVHNLAYSADGSAITATCSVGGCDLTENKISFNIVAPTLTTYGGTESASATLDGLDAFNTATRLAISANDIKYVGRGSTSYEESVAAPIDAGTYTAKISYGSGESIITASVDYAISKASIGTPSFTMADYKYGGTVSTPGEVSSNPGNATVTYYYNTTESIEGAKEWTGITNKTLNAGTYYMYAVISETSNYLGASTGYVSFNVNKADPPDIDDNQKPKASENLTYSKSSHPLVVAPIAANVPEGYTINYSLDGENWGVDIPTGIDAGEYTVKVKYAGDINHTDFAIDDITVTIAPKEVSDPKITIDKDSYTYTGQEIKPTVTVSDGETVIPDSEYTVEYSDNISAGDAATITIKDKEAGNYKVSGTRTFSIVAADKSELEEAISEAEEYYNSIKDDPEYSEIAEELKKLIEEAKAAIEALGYDETLTPEENKARVEAIIEKLKEALAAQRAEDSSKKDSSKEDSSEEDTSEEDKDEDDKSSDEKESDSTDENSGETPADVNPSENNPSIDEDEDNTSNKTPSYKNEWVDGKWYSADGTQAYKPVGKWVEDSEGWYYIDEEKWCPKKMWQKIDGYWYYFDEEGYMLTDQYCGSWDPYTLGYWWVGTDGRWDKSPASSWRMTGNKVWFGDDEGWSAHASMYKIGGKWYCFDEDGILTD